VPISLIITVELCKTIQAWFISQDLEMYYEKLDLPAIPRYITIYDRNFNIADDLGQVSHIFSDKTGTLTQNVMEFKKCSVGDGYVYGSDEEGDVYSEISDILKDKLHKKYQPLHNFILAIGICHSVLVALSSKQEISYKFQSPDEGALICAAQRIGYVLTDRNNDNVTFINIKVLSLKIFDELFQYQLLNVIEFDSDRKRMTVHYLIIYRWFLEPRIKKY
jgi:magnesium-transporting ATPase (P-type)